MSLASFDLLGTVVSSPFSAHPGRFDRLAIHHASARLGISAHTHPHSFAQGSVHPLEGALEPPSPEVVVDGLPGREVVGQQSPGAAALQDVEDGVEDLAQGV
jgi:hypothetical protein